MKLMNHVLVSALIKAAERQLMTEIEKLLSSTMTHQRFAVLATQDEVAPYTNLIAYSFTAELDAIFFLTPRKTKKYENILAKSGVSVFINTLSNQAEDIKSAVGISVTGTASEIDNEIKEKYLKEYLERHPYLTGFAWDTDNALIRVDVILYTVVQNFNRVEKFDPRPSGS